MSNENNCWISVKEKLPEKHKEVLVSNGYRNIHGITHWQPLPQPPKE